MFQKMTLLKRIRGNVLEFQRKTFPLLISGNYGVRKSLTASQTNLTPAIILGLIE
jgi:hypothetical protein